MPENHKGPSFLIHDVVFFYFCLTSLFFGNCHIIHDLQVVSCLLVAVEQTTGIFKQI